MALSCMGRPYEMPYGIITGGFATKQEEQHDPSHAALENRYLYTKGAALLRQRFVVAKYLIAAHTAEAGRDGESGCV